MWIYLSLISALLLGLYDVFKKQALKRNGVLWILFGATALSALFLSPMLSSGSAEHHLMLVAKAVLVSSSWISGLLALRMLPLTTVSTIKASRPMFVVLFSVLLFEERLDVLQWVGVALIMLAIFLLGRSSKKEGIEFKSHKGMIWMWLSVLTGAASALYDKLILRSLEPLFVQSWGNVYITAVLGILLLIKALREGKEGGTGSFRWDWRIVVIAVLITISDALYFFALKDSDALLSVVSMIRRCSVVITFLFGAFMFKEHNIRDKAVYLAILLLGLIMLLY